MKTPDTDVMAEAQKMVNESKEQFKENLSDVSFVTTPDTDPIIGADVGSGDKDTYIRGHIENGILHITGVEHTPDTEWEEKVKAEWSEYDNGVFRSLHSTIDFISTLLTSRDTYWKERVRKEVEKLKFPEIKHEGEMPNTEFPTARPAHESNEVFMQFAHNQALDTLLDNLK